VLQWIVKVLVLPEVTSFESSINQLSIQACICHLTHDNWCQEWDNWIGSIENRTEGRTG
jgi:hypothetical protein